MVFNGSKIELTDLPFTIPGSYFQNYPSPEGQAFSIPDLKIKYATNFCSLPFSATLLRFQFELGLSDGSRINWDNRRNRPLRYGDRLRLFVIENQSSAKYISKDIGIDVSQVMPGTVVVQDEKGNIVSLYNINN